MLPLEKPERRPDAWTAEAWLAKSKRRHRAVMDRRMSGYRAIAMSREDELAAISSYIAEHGVRRVTIGRDSEVRLRVVRIR